MDILDIFTFFVMIVLVGIMLFVLVKLGELPGRIATTRDHPQKEAISICGWFGILTLGLLWPLAFIWAYTKPAGTMANGNLSQDDLKDLVERLGIVEKQLKSTAQSD